MKKWITILLCCLLAFSALAFTACDSTNGGGKPSSSNENDGWTGIY